MDEFRHIIINLFIYEFIYVCTYFQLIFNRINKNDLLVNFFMPNPKANPKVNNCHMNSMCYMHG